jgi:exodeoxyribonuclease VII large subunit
MPRFVKTIVIITSNSGAAIEDMKKIASHRWPLVKIILIPTIVQGSNSAMDISKNIKLADSLSADVIIVGRGGGSIEDLWGFNEEVVADAIFEAKTPIVSAVGHESDVVISDFVADLRASTPSNAIELLLPDINEYRFYIDELYNKLNLGFKRVIIDKTKEINHLFDSFVSNSFENRFTLISKEIETIKGYFDKNFIDTLNIKSQELDNLTLQYDRYIQNIFIQKQQTLDNLSQGYEIHNPKTKNKDGIGYISKDGKKSNIEELKKDDEFEVENQKVTIKAKVLDKIWIK